MSSHRAPRRSLPRRVVVSVTAVAAAGALGVLAGVVGVRAGVLADPDWGVGAALTGHSSPHSAPHGSPRGATSGAPAGGVVRATGASTAEALRGRERAVSRDLVRVARRNTASSHLQVAAERDAELRTAVLAKQKLGADRQAHRIAATGWQLPVTKGVYHLTARFGSCSGLWSHCHTGLDFAAPTGTPIHAVASGTITETGYAGAYGNRTIMTLPDGSELWYCHQTAYVVHEGDKVVAGQVIGLVGSTGNTTGPHVHLEVRPNPKTPVDPFTALVAHGLHP